MSIFAMVANASQGSSGIGPVAAVVGLTIASALVLSWIIRRLPGSDENTGASPFKRRRKDPFGQPPDDPMDRPPRSPFDP